MKLDKILQGRIGRLNYFKYTVLSALAPLIFYLLERIIIFYVYPYAYGDFVVRGVLDILIVVINLAEIIAVALAVYVFILLSVRRAHDMGYSGALVFVPVGLSALTFIIPYTVILVALVQLWFIFMPGEPHDNKYGPVPFERAGIALTLKPEATHPNPRGDVISEIEKCAQMRANGVLSDAEFEAIKAQLLARERNA